MLGPNLIRNPDCILAPGGWGAGSLGPDDWISFNGDLLIASQQSVITEACDYKLIAVYESDSAFSAKVGDAAFQTIPAGQGAASLTFTVTDPASNGIVFRDGSEQAVGRILHCELRKIS